MNAMQMVQHTHRFLSSKLMNRASLRGGGAFTKGMLLSLFLVQTAMAKELTEKNGFVLDAPLVHEREILRGGPEKDGIPAIDKPLFDIGKKAQNMLPDERVLGVVFNGETKAYPIRILNFHEIVNDTFNRHPVAITYCPLCGTGMVFDASSYGDTLLFGVSGLLYNSDLLMFDRNTGSLWSQVEGLAINGPKKSDRLSRIPAEHTTWADWYQRYPDTQVLTRETGYWRDYSSTPYPGYGRSEHLYFPIANIDKRYHPKESVVGIEIDGKAKVYPFVELDKFASSHSQGTGKTSRYRLTDKVGEQQIHLSFDPVHRAAYIENEKGQKLPSVIAFWFAWMAFYPEAEVYAAP